MASTLNVAHVLATAYRPARTDSAAVDNVRAQAARLETVTELLKLMTEAPGSAITHGFTLEAGEAPAKEEG